MTRFLFLVAALTAGILPALAASVTGAEPPRTDRYGDALPKGAIARLGTLRMRGCWGPVVFSPDDKYVIAGGDEQVLIWNAASGRRVKVLTAKGNVTRLAVSPDGKQLAAISCCGHPDNLVTVWNVATGEQRFRFQGKSFQRGDVAFSADGKALVTSFGILQKATVRGYDTSDGKQNFEWSFDHPRPEDFILSPDGQFAAAPDDQDNAEISVFELRKKVKAKTLPIDVGHIHGCAFSRDGRRLVAGGDDGWVVWDWKSGQVLRAWEGKVTDTPAFSPDGRRLAWCGEEAIWVIDWDGGQPSRRGARNRYWRVRFSGDGRKLAAVTAGGALVLVDLRTGRDLLPLDAHTGVVISVAYFAGGRYLVTREPFRLLVWEDATGKLLRRFPDDLPAGETALLETASHGRIVTAELPDGIVRLRDLVTGKELRRLHGKHGYVNEAPAEENRRKDTDGRWRLSPEEAKERLRMLKLHINVDQTRFVDSVSSVYESPDSRYVLVSGLTQRLDTFGGPSPYNAKSFLRLWDAAQRRLIAELDGKGVYHRIVRFSSDGRRLLFTTDAPATVYLRESATGRERLRLVGHLPGFLTIAIRPDGRVLASGGYDTQVLLWDLTGRMPDGVWRQTRHTPEQLAELRKTLAEDDVASAYRAMWSLAAAPEQTLTLLRERLRPMVASESGRLARLLAALDSDKFAEREKATGELERAGELAEPALRQLLKGRPTLEQRRRCEQVLAKLSVLSGERLRAVRAVEVVERLGNAKARKLLEEWRQGVPEARLTQEARAALNRLAAAPK